MSSSYQKKGYFHEKFCLDCGAKYLGGNMSKYCLDCKDYRISTPKHKRKKYV